MKKIIILQHGGGELANQLWTFASIYAYCKEKGFECRNYSFFEYGQYFNIPIKNKIIGLVFFFPFRDYYGRRKSPRTRFFRLLYKMYEKIILALYKRQVVSSVNINNKKFSLPPTEENPRLSKMEQENDLLYFTGWLFRNPTGLEKYQTDIRKYFRPKEKYTLPAEQKIADAKQKYNHVIGVHIRQSDYRVYKSGEYLISQERICAILDEYLENFVLKSEETVFIITSDEPVNEQVFKGLNTLINNGNAIEDLYTLSLCDAIIGSNSTFGNFAAYLGDKPHIIFKKEKMDWEHYKDKDRYFRDMYSVMFL